MPSITLNLDPKSPLYRRILQGLRSRHELSKRYMRDRHDNWRQNEEKVIAYLPERDVDATRRATREGGKPQYTTIVLPYTYAMLMTAHTYWTTVFLGRNPIFQFSGRHGETEQQIQAMEAVIDYQVQVGEMLVPLYIWLQDVGKYGIGVVGHTWAEHYSSISSIEEVEEVVFGLIKTGRTKKKRFVRRVKGYNGNEIFNVRPYNWYPDPRVPLHRFQDGEFCGVYGEVGWNEIVRRAEAGYYTNIDRLRKTEGGTAGVSGGGDEHEHLGSSELSLPAITENLDVPQEERRFPDLVGKANFYGLYDYTVELVPADWGLGSTKYPEKWTFTTNDNFSVLLSARPQGYLHNRFPFDIMTYEPEGYALHTRGMPEVLDPIQRTMDWLLNSHFYNVRKALNHGAVVDPSKVVMKDLMSPTPGYVVRLRPSAYGSAPKDAIHQLNFQDVTRQNIGDIMVLHEFAQRIVGVNDQLMGVAERGGRRSATEARQQASLGTNRQKTQSEFYSAMGWSPMAQVIVQNTQQYMDEEMKFRLVGDLALEAGPQFVNVGPEAIQGFYDFVPVDGTLPIDRFAQANLWRELLLGIQRMPEVAGTYDIGRIFGWVAQLAGLKNINQFKIQVVPDQLATAQAQQGNVVPLGGRNPTEPGQISGVGPTG